jgi:hypothetical protein
MFNFKWTGSEGERGTKISATFGEEWMLRSTYLLTIYNLQFKIIKPVQAPTHRQREGRW